ncbi:MAG: hypothetical protein Q4D81_10535 [Eubacteriales bacterium]|nr:hypothetical protein [Eubacteriales bacterium]
MDRYFGFDLGDAESAVTFLKKSGQAEPEVVPVREAGSFITAYARLRTGELLIGEEACYAPEAMERRLRFKSRFLTDPSSARDVKSFAGGVLGELYMAGSLIKGEDCCFYIGCPAGWDRSARERYREIFEAAGYPPVRVISESRAALVSACQSRHFQVGYDILSRPVLVVDMGSSTTDFAYINSGREIELQTAGEVALGGGIMDELLLEAAVEASPDRDALRRVFEQSPPWRSYCEFAARRLKEKYFADEEYWKDQDCLQTVSVYADPAGSSGSGNPRVIRLQLRMDPRMAERILEEPAPQLGGKSFHAVFEASLAQIREKLAAENGAAENPGPAGSAGTDGSKGGMGTSEAAGLKGTEESAKEAGTPGPADSAGKGGSIGPFGLSGAAQASKKGRDRTRGEGRMPELLFLTGGVSRMPALRAWCRKAFPEAIVITGAEPEYSVSRGLAYSGRIDEELRAFRQEVRELVESTMVERIVEEHVEDLFHRTVDALVEPILRSAAIPVFDRWRSGEIRRLADIDSEMEREIDTFLHSPEAAELLVKPITSWLRPIAYRLEEYTMPICVRHNVPYRALSLTSFLSLAEIDVHVNARDVFAVEELTWMVNTIISILVGLLCGGSGIALLSSGISGIVAGAMLTLLLLFLGKDKMESAFMHMDIPSVMRKLLPRGYFEARMEKISGEVKRTCFETLEKDKSEDVTRRMVSEISGQIEECLLRMAEVVEIPLG